MHAPETLAEAPLPVRLTLESSLSAVRQGLVRLMGMPPLCLLGDEGRGTAEIVLAEALNNIVEHAYGGQAGDIRVEVLRQEGDILCRIRDQGRPMPGGAAPPGALQPLGEHEDLPEGGFGWFLIRVLARDVQYDRDGGENILTFRLDAA
jgi:serine/threonine-protein kinase RsbW